MLRLVPLVLVFFRACGCYDNWCWCCLPVDFLLSEILYRCLNFGILRIFEKEFQVLVIKYVSAKQAEDAVGTIGGEAVK